MARHPDPPARRSLTRDRRGNVAILFAFISMPMLMLSGAAVDYGFATRLETKLQAATDATALLLCQTPLTTTTPDLNTLAQTTMVGAMGATDLSVDPLVITSNPRQITLTAHKVSTTFFGKLTGTTRINPGAKSQCATPLPKTFEIALVLDNTGSMAESSGGQSKLQAVQTAATNFVNYVYTNSAFSSATRVSIVPFAGAVAVNPATYRYASWIDQSGLSSLHWTNVTFAEHLQLHEPVRHLREAPGRQRQLGLGRLPRVAPLPAERAGRCADLREQGFVLRPALRPRRAR